MGKKDGHYLLLFHNSSFPPFSFCFLLLPGNEAETSTCRTFLPLRRRVVHLRIEDTELK